MMEKTDLDKWLEESSDELPETNARPSDEIDRYQKLVKMEELSYSGNPLSPHIKARIRLVMEELVCGLSPHNIWMKWGRDWDISLSTIHQYSVIARKLIATELLQKDSDIRNDLLAKYNHLYKKSYEAGKLQQCKEILDSITRLTQRVQLDITSGGEPIQTIRLIEVQSGDEIQQIPITPHEEE